MRRLVLIGCAVGLMAPVVSAADPQRMSGCGLGYILLSHDTDSRLLNLTAVTTNGTSGSQTFGITSGTSGCNSDGALVKGKEAIAYAEVNFDSLRREMAIGQGEFVETFATLVEADAARRPAVLQMFKTDYAVFFPSSQSTPQDLLAALDTKLRTL
jgi:hypothetical protein